MKEFVFRNGSFCFDKKGIIMGILNVTPDSFSDGGKFLCKKAAIEKIKEMISHGANIIDIGAMSTRPGSEPVTVQEEINRLAPVLTEAVKIENIVISIDTVNPETARFALENGANIINDVSGIFSEAMATVIKEYNAGWIVTHTGGVASGSVIDYPQGVIHAVNEYFDYFLNECRNFGIEKKYICLDPGFGFAKTAKDNTELLKNLENVIRPDVAFLTALSRKRFIGEITAVPIPEDRMAGTLAANLIALMKGSNILRVHDVEETRQIYAVYNSI